MLPALPTEILEAIINASKENRRTLGACGEAARQLLPRTRVHLFAKIMLGSPRADITRQHNATYPSGPTRCDLLFDILQANPTLAEHVTDLALCEGGHPTLTVFWISRSSTLVSVAQLLSNLRKFTLRTGQASQWSDVLIGTMRACIQRPSLQFAEIAALHIVGLEPLLTIFNGTHPGRKLRHLRLSNVIIPSSSSSSTLFMDHHNPLEVHTLNVAFHLDLSHLHHLRLTMGRDIPTIGGWLQLSAQSLVQLDLKFIGDWIPFGSEAPSEMDQYFPQTTQLLVLRLEISVFEAMPSVLTVLRMLRAPNLTEIVFSSRRYGCFHTAPHLHGLWPQLDSAISILRFPNLTAVRFEAGRTSPPDEWGPRLRAQLPQLDDTGRLIL
ncbi:hypothetical protein B0H13DRAFT_1976072 [Mycena leptocephala]|nr:hypothetical protein B0H13DRAFT_1976072 [Mycena leptocephala]